MGEERIGSGTATATCVIRILGTTAETAVEEIAVLLEAGKISTADTITASAENTGAGVRRGRVRRRRRGEIVERTEEETEEEDETIRDLDLARDLRLVRAQESGTAEETNARKAEDDGTVARDLARRLREEEGPGVTTMTTITTMMMMAADNDIEGHLGETSRTEEETGRRRIRARGLRTKDEDEAEEAIKSTRIREIIRF